jgi:uncharacterized protein YcbK (DUF882 family)
MFSVGLSLDRRNPWSRRLCALGLAAVAALASLPLQAASERSSPDVTPATSPRMPDPKPLPTSMTSDPTAAEAPTQEPAEVPRARAHLQIVGTAEMATIDLPLDGNLGPDEAREIAHLFRCRRTHRERPIDPRVLAFLADIAMQWPEHAIEIVSGFRAPPYGAPHSKHFKGQAIDLRVHGVRTTKLRDHLWREHRGVGVGYYERENFVHMDTRFGEPDQAWTAEEEGGEQDYNPRWALKARRIAPNAARSVAASTTVAPTVRLAVQSNAATSF